MTVDAFFSIWNGKGADFDGWYGDQCVDLFNFYNRDVVGAPFVGTPITGGAADLWTNFENSSLVKFYDRVANSASFVPRKGDVMIWAANTPATGTAGHVAICTGEGDSSYFVSFDQNYPTGSLPHFQRHSYTGVYGVLRPKQLTTGGDEVITKDDIDEVRIINSEVGGYNFDDTHTGKFDSQEMGAWTGQPYKKMLDQKWAEGEAFRKQRAANAAQAALVPGLQQQVADLQAQLDKGVSEDQAAAVVAIKANPLFDFLRLVLSKLTKKQ